MGEMADWEIEQMDTPWDGMGYSPADQLCATCLYFNMKDPEKPYLDCELGIDLHPDTRWCGKCKEL